MSLLKRKNKKFKQFTNEGNLQIHGPVEPRVALKPNPVSKPTPVSGPAPATGLKLATKTALSPESKTWCCTRDARLGIRRPFFRNVG